VRNRSGIAIAGVGLVASVLGILNWTLPGLRHWLNSVPELGWTLAAVFLALAIVIWLIKAERLRTILEQRDQFEHKIEELKAERLRTILEQRDQFEHKIEELKAIAYPTERDRRQFKEVLELWPWNSGILSFLEMQFNAKMWSGSDVDPLYHFLAEWRERFFDSSEVNVAFKNFYRSCAKLSRWMSHEGAPDVRYRTTSNEDFIYTIADGSKREGGWNAYDAARENAMKYVGKILYHRRQFEEAGRRNGL